MKIIVLLLFFPFYLFAQQSSCDILIHNGKIIDGTGNSWFYGDIAIKDGKIIGIGISALIQFCFWVLIIGIGLYAFRETLFPDLLDAANMNALQMSEEVKSLTLQERMFSAKEYNEFVELVYERVNFGNMLFYFILFFIVGYLFYGTFFATLGAISGSESDGQQFVIPLIFLLFLTLFMSLGYGTKYF